jgi:hypothetical protein
MGQGGVQADSPDTNSRACNDWLAASQRCSDQSFLARGLTSTFITMLQALIGSIARAVRLQLPSLHY